MMLLAMLIFVFVTTGLKVIAALIVIYYLLPADGRCRACGRETIPLVIPRLLRPLARLFRLHRRWCPGCHDRSLARGGREIRVWVGPAERSRAGHLG